MQSYTFNVNYSPYLITPIYKKQPRLKRCGTICVKYIFNVAHILIVRGKRSRIWSLPKGCINQGETEIQCAQRETLEESGLSIDLNDLTLRVCINHNVYFVVIIKDHPKLKIRDKDEIDKVSWMTLNEIKTLECNKDLRSILQYPKRRFNFHNQLIDILKLETFQNSPSNEADFNALSDTSSVNESVSEDDDEKLLTDIHKFRYQDFMQFENISYDPPPGLF